MSRAGPFPAPPRARAGSRKKALPGRGGCLSFLHGSFPEPAQKTAPFPAQAAAHFSGGGAGAGGGGAGGRHHVWVDQHELARPLLTRGAGGFPAYAMRCHGWPHV